MTDSTNTPTDGSEFIGKEITVRWEPYGPNTFVIDRISRRTYIDFSGTEREVFDISGIVSEGSTGAFCCGNTIAITDNAGRRRDENSIRRDELEAGFARKIAC